MGDQLLMYIGPYQDVVIYISVSNTWFGVGASHSTVFCSSLKWYGAFWLFCSGNLVPWDTLPGVECPPLAYSTIVRKVRKSPCTQDEGRSVERIIIHAGILQNSCEIHATFPATRQYRQISRANFSCVMPGNIFHGRSIFRYGTCRCV